MRNTGPFSIALVDDEETLRISLAYALEREGYLVRTFGDGNSAWEAMRKERPDLILLDIMMPGLDGLELCRRIRKIDREAGIIFLTSRNCEYERVMGLEIGGDDYLCKPFSLRELIARVGVQARRRGRDGGTGSGNDRITTASVTVDRREFRAFWMDTDMGLTATEFRLLWTLVSAPGRAWKREELNRLAYEEPVYVDERTLDSHIKRLRGKIGAAGGDPGCIETVYSIGYRFREKE
jgi:two-component system, OmpR family, response regulator ChvI